MWPFCYAHNPLWLLLPFLIGLLAGWWAWGWRPVVDAAVRTFTPAPVFAPPLSEAPVATALTAIGVPAAMGDPDNLKEIKGIGPTLSTLLASLGVTRFDQIAAWTPEHIAIVDGHLGAFKGRIERDSWVLQARLLANGAIDEFERRYGTLESGQNN